MIGLEYEIEKRKIGKLLDRNERVSYVNIAKIINKPYTTTKRKITGNTLTVDEALKIFKTLFNAKSKFDAFEYLFTEYKEQ